MADMETIWDRSVCEHPRYSMGVVHPSLGASHAKNAVSSAVVAAPPWPAFIVASALVNELPESRNRVAYWSSHAV